MASIPSPEVQSILARTRDLMIALSNEPLGVAGLLLSKGFISGEIMSKMLVVSYTSMEKATILVEAVRNKIELVPSKFPELLEILSEVTCAKEVVAGLRFTYQSLIEDQTKPIVREKPKDIAVTIEDFEDRFRNLHKEIVHQIVASGKDTNTVLHSLTLLPMKLRKEYEQPVKRLHKYFPFFYRSNKESINDLFFRLNPLFSFLDYGLLEYIIKLFGSDSLKKDMSTYSADMQVFMKNTTIKELIDLLPGQRETPPNFEVLKAKIGEDASKCTLDRINTLRRRFCAEVRLSEVVFCLIALEDSNSFIISWLVPSVFVPDLIESTRKGIFNMKHVISTSIGKQCLYDSKLVPFGAQLEKQYQQSHGLPSPVEWIPSPTKKIFRLAMIQRERVQRGCIEDRFVQMTISGRVDDILHAKSPVELEHIFRNTRHGGEIILIEGAPGSGKSTLTVDICQRWGKGELFQQFTVVILVQLRDPAVQRAQTIADLLPVENIAVAQELATELIATNGRGVLWVLDGWDELPPNLQQDSIIRKLLPPKPSSIYRSVQTKQRLLNDCSVIITSRPISSGDLHPVVSSRIEVLGFTPEEQRRYFTECLKVDTKTLEALLEKIQENPVVQSICYLPLNAAFIVHTFKYRGQSLPNTEYEIYLSVILSCIQRHFEEEGGSHDLPGELASFDDLCRSEALREPFQCLCELAYRGVMENKVTFSSSDLPQGSNTLSLLQAIESFLQSGKSVFYSFLHLSIQEVLSAYYIATQLSDSQQVSKFQQLFNQPRFAAVFQFYVAITKLKSPGIRQVIDRMVEEKSKPLLLSLLRCLHEAQDPSLCHYVAESLGVNDVGKMQYVELGLSGNSLSPLDSLSLSFFLFSAGMAIKGDFSRCSIGDLGAKSLAKYLDGSVDHVSKATIYLLVSDNNIREEGASHISRIINFIEHLNLSHNLIGDTGASLIFEAASKAARLKTLSLDMCGITSKFALHIAKILYFTEHINMSDNPIGDTGASLISEAVRETATLKTLILFSCGITSRGAEDLSRALAQNSSLENLDIGGNNLGDEGISHVAEALKQNEKLKELCISGCGMTDKGAASLASAVSVNNSLKMLHFGITKGALTEDGLSTISQSLANKSEFVKLEIPGYFDYIIGHLSRKVNETRKRNGLPSIEIETSEVVILGGPSEY